MAARHKWIDKSGTGKRSRRASSPFQPVPATLSYAAAAGENDYAAKLLAMKGTVADDVDI